MGIINDIRLDLKRRAQKMKIEAEIEAKKLADQIAKNENRAQTPAETVNKVLFAMLECNIITSEQVKEYIDLYKKSGVIYGHRRGYESADLKLFLEDMWKELSIDTDKVRFYINNSDLDFTERVFLSFLNENVCKRIKYYNGEIVIILDYMKALKHVKSRFDKAYSDYEQSVSAYKQEHKSDIDVYNACKRGQIAVYELEAMERSFEHSKAYLYNDFVISELDNLKKI